MAEARRKSSIVSTGRWRNTIIPLIPRSSASLHGYPRTSPSFIGAIHDARRTHGLFDNPSNFSQQTNCEVYEARREGGLQQFALDESSAHEWSQILCHNTSNGKQNPVFRVVFCALEQKKGKTSFNYRVSLSASIARQLLQSLDVTSQFVGLLLGEPDYGAPGDFAVYDDQGVIRKIEFCCQQPRWNIHKTGTPWSIYMTHDIYTNDTTYIVVCDPHQSRFDTVKERLTDIFSTDRAAWNSLEDSTDPFLLHVLVTHECFLDATPEITGLRHKLYDALDRVDRYAEADASERKRSELEALTIQLHVVSQEIDRMAANVEMSKMIVHRLSQAHARYRENVRDVDKKDSQTKTHDALNYLFESINAQQRWLASYKSRKDIAMNLVSSLVLLWLFSD
ncbi:hypothetical protein BU16DRAFT_533977 [Lophium mytilinum]|uniref:Uncharacterized protein n=1 Tax=Lophium mytilinum TaxID=390894 RepID=A0A6A6RAA7_9PEZI|nr:hypothetical protein BU16DRAFT_533977 [Lophium mytilinum]